MSESERLPGEGERPVGRSTKLDENRLRSILGDLKIGLSEQEAAERSGICKRTFCYWKSRAKAAGEVLPADWALLKFEEMLAVAEELDIDVRRISRTGRRGRLTREDLLREIRGRAELYVDFLRQVDAAKPERKRAILQVVDDLIQGRVKIRRTRTTQVVRYVERGGAMVPEAAGEAVVVTEVLELPPDRQAALKMLAMGWPEEFSERRGAGGGGVADPSASAREVSEAVRRMLSTVPGPAGLLTEGEGEEA